MPLEITEIIFEPLIRPLYGAFLGAVLSYYLPRVIAWNKLRKRPGFSGEWQSTWEPKSIEKPEWVSEKMVVKRQFDAIQMTNFDNSFGYNYACEGKLVKGKHLTGKWYSTNDTAHADGAFILTITPQGNCMYGQIVGPNDEGDVNAGKFILGKTEKDIEFGKKMLEKHAGKNDLPKL